MKLDFENWKEFIVSNIFEDKKNKKYSKIPEDGNIPFVSCTSINNGVVKYCNLTPNQENAITVSTNGACFDCFWHKGKFCASSDVEVLYCKNHKLIDKQALFLCSSLQTNKGLYDFANKPKNGKVWSTKIKLPVDDQGNPDWQFMEDYMKQLEEPLINKIKNAIPKLNPIDSSDWKEFIIGKTFKCKATQTNELPKFEEGTTPFICASNTNNGIQGFVTPKPTTEVEKGNCITLSSLDGTCFYQAKDFIGRGHGSVNVIRHEKLNELNALFLCSVIKKTTSKRFNYADQIFLGALEKIKIKLPAKLTSKGEYEPDWQFMENYMKGVK